MKYGFPMILPTIIERSFGCLIHFVSIVKSCVLCWLWGIGPGRSILFQGKTLLRTHRKGDITIGDCVVFNSLFNTNSVGLTNATFLDTRAGGKIKIGSHCGFSSVIISSRSSVCIGNNVLIGGNVRIFDHDFHAVEWQHRRSPECRKAVRSKPIVIEDDVFIGMNAILLKGTRVGARSIIAAGSVVFGLNIPPDSLVKGNPAEIVER